ncbi:unnamed protein product [Notodromas monacha]|uniref:Protein cereblon n=1 Tax=Notodromas monacha TaxID=399045 RepID=A0A7R9BIP6_9CRUS|nr:unnamed protein product [Notodromas monacha]CAG0915940.1 unnamed protein product [Notodromas monacha]
MPQLIPRRNSNAENLESPPVNVSMEIEETDGVEEEEEESSPLETFDKGLPAKHLYLGENLEELKGYGIEPDEFEEVEIPLIPERNFALVPGQVFPFSMYDPAGVSLFMGLIRDRKEFGVRFNEETEWGTMAQIYEYSVKDEDSMPSVCVKARGRRRFLIKSIRTCPNGLRYAKVLIQPEVRLQDCMLNARFSSLNKLRLPPIPKPVSRVEDEVEETSSSDVSTNDDSCDSDDKPELYHPPISTSIPRQFDYACSPFPMWVHDMYDERRLAKRVRESIPVTSYVAQNRKKFLQTSENMPMCPVELSHWVARSLPIPESDRIALLRFNSAAQRLRYELSLTAIDKFRTLGCYVCGKEIAKQGDVISMSDEGPQGVFINAGGYIHDLLTFSKLLVNMQLVGEREEMFSWFPGYAWRIGECPACTEHLGWRFDAVEPKLVPRKFFALLKNKISWSSFALNEQRETMRPHS